MSDSNRGRLGKAGLAVAALAAVVSGGSIWHTTSLKETQYQLAADRDEQQQASAAGERIELECSVLEPSFAECVQQIEQEASQAQQGRDDLHAQRTMAVWTRAMGIAAIIGMSVGVLGLGLIFYTFRETRRAAEAGRDANAIARDQQRARIVPFARWEPVNLNEGQIVLGCENVGFSPAFNLRCAITIDVDPPKRPPIFDEWGEKRLVKTGGGTDLTIADSRVLDGALVGCIKYDTIFSKDRKTFFCLRFEQSPRNGQWYSVDCTPETWPRNT